MKITRVGMVFVTAVLLLLAGPAWAVDVLLDVSTQNATSLDTVTYRLGGTTVTTSGAAAQTPVALAATGLATGQHTLFSSFGELTIDVAGDGMVTHVSGPFSVLGSDLTIQNTVDLGSGTLTVVPRFSTSFPTVGYQFYNLDEGQSAIGPNLAAAGDPATAVIFPFSGMTPGMVFYIYTSLGQLAFITDAGGALVHAGFSGVEGSTIPGELFTITGSTITIENDVGFPTLTVDAEQPTSVNTFAASIFDFEGHSLEIGPSTSLPGNQAAVGVTLPFSGMARYTDFVLYTTVGRLAFKLDANGDIAPGLPSIPGSDSFLLFSASGAKITLKNRAGFPEVRVRTAAPTSLSGINFTLVPFVYPTTGNGTVQAIPGSAAMSGVTFPLFGVLPHLELQVQSDLGSPFVRIDQDGNLAPGTLGVLETIETSGSAATLQNLINFKVKVTLDHAAATDITYQAMSVAAHASGTSQTLFSGQLEGEVDLEALGMMQGMWLQIIASSGNVLLILNPDGSADFQLPATNVTPTKGSYPIEGGTNTMYLELLPLAPRVTGVDPAPNALSVPLSSDVTVSFTEPIDALSVTSSSFRLLDDLGVPVPASLSVAAGGITATLDPTAALAVDTIYTVELTAGVQDLTGVGLEPYQSFFNTGTAASGVELDDPVVATQTGSPPNALDARAGAAVASAGDLNGDTIDDLLTGAPGYTVGANTEAGAAIVYFGSADAGERATPDIIFVGTAAGNLTGASIAGGVDLNSDDKPDIVIGVPGFDPASGVDAGATYVIFFDPTDATHYPLLNDGDPNTTGDVVDLSLVGGAIPGVVFTGAAAGDQLGFAVAVGGRLNAGPDPDIAIGAPGRTVNALSNAGTAYVIFDIFDQTLSGTIDLGRVANGQGDQIEGVVYEGGMADGALGFSVAFVGDVVGNGGDDLALGAPLADTVVNAAPVANAGIAYIVAGGGITTGIIEICDVGTSVLGAQIHGDQVGEQLSYSLSRGYDNLANGQEDLLIGSPFYSYDPDDAGPLPLRTGAGRVVQTASTLINGIIEVCDVGNGPATTTGVIWLGAATGDQLGTAVAGVQDVTGNGFDDSLLGAPFADVLTGMTLSVDAGAAYLIEGGTQNIALGIIEICDVGVSIAGIQYTGTQPNENAGAALAALGDFSNSGTPDFAVGAPGRTATESNAGVVYVVLEAIPPLPGACGPAGCTVADLANGAQLIVLPNALAVETTLAVTGITDPLLLPGPPPAGKTLVAAADFDTEGQSFGAPLPKIDLPVRQTVQAQIGSGELFDVFFWSGSAWVDSGFDGAERANVYYSARKSIRFEPDTLHVYATFFDDLDGDQTRDSLDTDRDGDGVANESDNCPDTVNPTQRDCNLDTLGDACDPSASDSDGDGWDDACDNCPGLANLGQADADGDGSGDACDTCPLETVNDADGDGLCCPADNCCSVANASQSDSDSDDVGDACDGNAVVRVSSDGADVPDFFTVQTAVDTVPPGVRIEVLPGFGPYAESVTFTRSLIINLVGVDPTHTATPIVIDGGAGSAIDIAPTVPATRLRGLTLRGATGLRASSATVLDTLTFESISDTALDLDAGTHLARDIAMGPTVVDGIDIAAGATLQLERAELNGLSGVAIRLHGTAIIETTLINAAASGIVFEAPSASLTLRHATIADATGAGVDRTIGGSVTLVNTILWNNAGGDLVAAPCTSASWSDIGTPDCSSVNDNLSVDPQFVGGGYHLGPTSPLFDYGPHPSTFTGTPCRDLDGGPRLRDADGNGLAQSDPGVYESAVPRTPGPVTGLVWASKTSLGWSVEPAATEYHVYRGSLSTLGYTDFGVCRDDLDGLTTDTVLDDAESPASGQGYYYRITAEDGGGNQGSLGLATCAERSTFIPCP